MTTQTQIKTDEDELIEAEAEHKAQQNEDDCRPVQTPEHAYARIIDVEENPEDYIEFEIVLDTGAYHTLRVSDLDRFKSDLGIDSLATVTDREIPAEYYENRYSDGDPYYTVAYHQSDNPYIIHSIKSNILSVLLTLISGFFCGFALFILLSGLSGVGSLIALTSIIGLFGSMILAEMYLQRYKDHVEPWEDIGF